MSQPRDTRFIRSVAHDDWYGLLDWLAEETIADDAVYVLFTRLMERIETLEQQVAEVQGHVLDHEGQHDNLNRSANLQSIAIAALGERLSRFERSAAKWYRCTACQAGQHDHYHCSGPCLCTWEPSST